MVRTGPASRAVVVCLPRHAPPEIDTTVCEELPASAQAIAATTRHDDGCRSFVVDRLRRKRDIDEQGASIAAARARGFNPSDPDPGGCTVTLSARGGSSAGHTTQAGHYAGRGPLVARGERFPTGSSSREPAQEGSASAAREPASRAQVGPDARPLGSPSPASLGRSTGFAGPLALSSSHDFSPVGLVGRVRRSMGRGGLFQRRWGQCGPPAPKRHVWGCGGGLLERRRGRFRGLELCPQVLRSAWCGVRNGGGRVWRDDGLWGLPLEPALWRRGTQCLWAWGLCSQDVRSVGGFLRACVGRVQRGAFVWLLRSA